MVWLAKIIHRVIYYMRWRPSQVPIRRHKSNVPASSRCECSSSYQWLLILSIVRHQIRCKLYWLHRNNTSIWSNSSYIRTLWKCIVINLIRLDTMSIVGNMIIIVYKLTYLIYGSRPNASLRHERDILKKRIKTISITMIESTSILRVVYTLTHLQSSLKNVYSPLFLQLKRLLEPQVEILLSNRTSQSYTV